jgi:4-amino-4-deoxy-L-arabinose transferase-like glycosyltransferase
MATRQATATREMARVRAIPWILLSYLAIGLAALLPRVLDLGVFLTGDEADFWLRRSDTFLRAIQSGDFAATAITTHPGVTTMWLGSAGIVLRRTLFESGILHDETFPTVLALTRLPTAIVHGAGILLGYRLLRHLLPAATAFLAALFWAADPFVIGYSRVLHVDALAGTFATLSLLAACVAWHHQRRTPMLILSGVCTGLAILSKSPALALLPAVGLIGLAAAWRPPTPERARYIVPRPPTTDHSPHPSSVVRGGTIYRALMSVVPLLVWGAVVAVTVFALWPALWVGPLRAYDNLRVGVTVEGAEPHLLGNFFLGRADDAPGPLFYPVALVLRLTPWALLGLLALPLALRRAPPATRRDMAALVGFVVLFIVAMSLFPKKFNRYLIPVFPVVDILAAIGIVGIIDFRHAQLKIKNLQSKIMLFGVVLLAVANAAWWHPYGIAYFNQALGGAQIGARTFLAGWGEGFEQVADWLNQQPDITGVVTVSPMVSSLQPYMRRHAQASAPDAGALPRKTGYVVVYIRQVQDGQTVPPFDQFYGRAVPLHTVRIHGVDYAYIYQVPSAVAHPRPADFGPLLHLRGFDPGGTAQRGKPLALKLSWEVSGPPSVDYTLFAHLIGPDGRRYTQADLPYPTSQWRPGHPISTDLPLLIPADAPAGAYRLVIGLYDPASNQRLSLTSADPIDPALDGPDALPLTEVRLD